MSDASHQLITWVSFRSNLTMTTGTPSRRACN